MTIRQRLKKLESKRVYVCSPQYVLDEKKLSSEQLQRIETAFSGHEVINSEVVAKLCFDDLVALRNSLTPMQESES